jgi:hypothetical protein
MTFADSSVTLAFRRRPVRAGSRSPIGVGDHAHHRRRQTPSRRAHRTAVLRTWGSAMTHHPHIYMIVPGRGMLSVRALSKLFRHLFLTRLIELHTNGARLLGRPRRLRE